MLEQSASFAVTRPPPTRGSVAARTAALPTGSAPPAHAGISRSTVWCSSPTLGAPRPRGDQSWWVTPVTGCATRPPPTRGSVVTERSYDVTGGAPPAHAGISRLASRRASCRSRAPRPRGDQSSVLAGLAGDAERPPPTRGSVAGIAEQSGTASAPPAHAGISRWRRRCWAPTRSAPRPRGDQSPTWTNGAAPKPRPPPTRGSVAFGGAGRPRPAAPPAHAGISRRG